MKKFKGIPVSKGISIGRITKYSKEKITGTVYQIEEAEVEREIQRYIKARDRANEYLSGVKEKARKELGSKELQIFDAHYYMLNDPVLDSQIRKIIRDKHLNAETAIRQAVDEVVDKFRRAGNSYIKERARDIEDVKEHLLRALCGKTASLRKLPEESIILAEDLNPSETAMLDKANLKGFILTQGGETAHSSIMAKSLMIPAVIQVKNIDREVKEGDQVILDAVRGEVIVNPDNGLQDCYQKQIEEYQRRKQRLLRLRDKRAVTIDGFELDIAANINSAEEMGLVREVNGDGIGLFRTEFLFSGEEELRDEERQFRIYREVLEEMKSAPVIIRTLDIGGDKELPYFTVQEEINPFLGWRGIRISLSTKDIFKCQLRALMRASVYGNLKILLPLISSMEELRKAQSLLNEVREELAKDNIPFDESVKVGIMVEVPAVAVMADSFASEVDFFSIGTNDLIQYTLAVDRTNSKIAELYTPYHPAVLKLILQVVKAAHSRGIPVSICGEAAADPLLLPLFVGMGISELSMNTGSILEVKALIRNLRRESAIKLLREVLKQDTAEKVREFIDARAGRH